MNAFERLLIWFGGYRPQTLAEERPDEREQIAKIGGAVLFATVIAAINWGIASRVYSASISPMVSFAVIVMGAFIGAFMAALFDRSFLYFYDTSIVTGRLKIGTYGVARIAIILVIASFTSQAVMPLLLDSELKAQALKMTENSEKTRMADLNSRFRIDQKETNANDAAKKVEALRLALVTLPANIQHNLTVATQCWSVYAAHKSQLLQQGYSSLEVQDKLASRWSYCSGITKAANNERNSYVFRTEAQLAQAEKDKGAKDTDLVQTATTIKTKVEHAGQIETESFNPRSSVVLWAMLKDNLGARLKWALFSILLILLELLPLILKCFSGQSNIGCRIAHIRERERLLMSERMENSRHDHNIYMAVNAASKEAVIDAMSKPEVKAIFAHQFVESMSSIAPLEASRATMRDMEARYVDVNDFMSRCPKLATVAAQVWSKAIKETSEILTRGVNVGPVN